jgi:Skp family chaperone for outer membrane proteins
MKFDLTKISPMKNIAVLTAMVLVLGSSIWSQSSTASNVAMASPAQAVAPSPAPERWR